MKRLRIGLPLLASLAICSLWVAPAGADSAYDTTGCEVVSVD